MGKTDCNVKITQQHITSHEISWIAIHQPSDTSTRLALFGQQVVAWQNRAALIVEKTSDTKPSPKMTELMQFPAISPVKSYLKITS